MRDADAYPAQVRVYRRCYLFGHKLNHESRHSGIHLYWSNSLSILLNRNLVYGFGNL
jgi:hypothetical protein